MTLNQRSKLQGCVYLAVNCLIGLENEVGRFKAVLCFPMIIYSKNNYYINIEMLHLMFLLCEKYHLGL